MQSFPVGTGVGGLLGPSVGMEEGNEVMVGAEVIVGLGDTLGFNVGGTIVGEKLHDASLDVCAKY